MIDFAFDRIIQGTPYPNCALLDAIPGHSSWSQFSVTFPNTDPFRLINYLESENIKYSAWPLEAAPVESFYPINVAFFRFDFDYFAHMSDTARQRVQNKTMKILFFYSEADNPQDIQQRLFDLCKQHNFDTELVYFISANSAAEKLDNFFYFPDDEIIYRLSQDLNQQTPFHSNLRPKKYTALVRVDKLWRAILMANLWTQQLHTDAFFSYNMVPLEGSYDYDGTPLYNDFLTQQQPLVDQFLQHAPFKADTLSSVEQNLYRTLVKEHYQDSYWNFVIETFLNVDSSGGAFLTEKTFKPICHNQFFVIAGAANSLAVCRDLGYKTFSRFIDESYDQITNDQERFDCVLDLAVSLASKSHSELHSLYCDLEPEITHNSKLYACSKKQRLLNLVDKLLKQKEKHAIFS